MRLTGLSVEVPSERTIDQELAEYDSTDFIAVPSSFVATTFVGRGVSPAKLLVNPYGVDTSFFAAAHSPQPNTTKGGIRVLHVGRVCARKGVHYLADAVSRVPGARLTFVGSVDFDLQRLPGNQQQATVVGAVPGPELPHWYRQADVFCLLSIEEGLALVTLQAMAMGLPVIATPNTGAEELIEDGVHGFIVPARDPGAAAARLQQLADDPDLRREMGNRARARIVEGFDWAHYGDRARAHYARITNRTVSCATN
jgi:glycosyltransferase involved in cell wall biosynthesis